MRLGELLHRGAEHPNGADADAGRDRRRQRLPPGHASTGRHCSRIRALGSRLDAHGFNSIGAVDQLHHPDVKNS